MPLLISFDDIVLQHDEDEEPVSFDAEVSADGTVTISGEDGDLESCMAFAGFGLELPQMVFCREFDEYGLAGLLTHRLFAEDTYCALTNRYYKKFGTKDDPYDANDFALDLGQALKWAIKADNFEFIGNITDLINELENRKNLIGFHTTKTPMDLDSDFQTGVWHKMELYIGERDAVFVAEWDRYFEKGVQDPIHFYPPEEGRETTEYPTKYAPIEHTIRNLGLVEEEPEVPDPEHPESDSDGRWGVVYLDPWRDEFNLVHYATLNDAEAAADLSMQIIDHYFGPEGWKVLIVQYDGIFAGRDNLLEREFPGVLERFPNIDQEANVLVPYKLVEDVTA